MAKGISRRDFINGVSLGAIGMGLSPFEAMAQGLIPRVAIEPDYYPPALTGLRGSHAGSFEVAHALAREGKKFSRPKRQTESTYDLVVVGGGISGLSAAKFFRDRRAGDSRILVLDNHDDFGGHATRDEFDVDGKTLLSYGGSQTLENPASYSKAAKNLLRDLSIHVDRFHGYFDQQYFKDLNSGIYFDRASYGARVITRNPMDTISVSEPLSPAEVRAAVRKMPISEKDQVAFQRLLDGGVDYLEGRSRKEKVELLSRISYLDYLRRYANVPDSVRGILQDLWLWYASVGWEALSAMTAANVWLPGTLNLGVQEDDEGEPYIHHFPDGNASVARALVRDLVPEAIPGATMEDLVTAPANYAKLDTDDSNVRIRLNSTAVNVAHTSNGSFVDVTYVTHGDSFRVRARHVVLACYNAIIPYICPEVSRSQANALGYASKAPFVIGNVALRNWRGFFEAGYFAIYSPGNVYFKDMHLGFPVSMGEYKYARGPDDPIVLTGWYSPTTRGLPVRDQYRAGRARILGMTYRDFEQNLFSHLDAMLGPYGFDVDRDVAAVTMNRWPHGYAYGYEELGSPAEYHHSNGPHVTGRTQMGRVSIANSDSEATAYVNGAIDAADRAVNEQLN